MLAMSLFLPRPLKADELEQTLFDLYVSDKKIGYAMVEFTATRFELLETSDVIEQLKKSKLVNVSDELLPLLSGAVEKERTVDGIGTLRFDYDNFRAVLIPNEKFAARVIDGNKTKIDPYTESVSGIGIRNDFGAAGNFLSDANSQSLAHRSTVSFGNFWLQADGSFDDDDYVPIEYSQNLLFDRFKLSSGLLFSKTQQFSTATSFAGVLFESIDSLVSPDNSLRASEIVIFVSSKSDVKITRGSEVLYQGTLDYGSHQIQTRGFPTGSYVVEIQIIDSKGETTRETRFFSSSGFLALTGYPAFTFAAGKLRRDEEILSESYFQAGSAVRVATNLQVGAQVAGTNEVQNGTLSALAVIDTTVVGGGVSRSTEDDTGYFAILSGNIGTSIRLSGGYERTLPSLDRELDSALNPSDPVFVPPGFSGQPPTFGELNRLRNGATRYSFTVGYTFERVDFDLVGQTQREDEQLRNDGLPERQIGPRIRWRAIVEPERFLTVEAGLAYSDIGDSSYAGLNWQILNFPWSIAANSRVRGGAGDGQSNAFLSPTLRYQDNDRAGFGTTAFAAAEYQDSDALGARRERHRFALQHVGATTSFGALAQETSFFESHSQSVYANSSFIMAPDGTTTFSSPPRASGTVVITVNGDPSVGEVMVAVNGQSYASVKVGDRLTIGLIPYQRYEIGIRGLDREKSNENAKNAGIPRLDQTVYKFVSLPGSVASYTFVVDKIFIVTGRLMDRDGNPVENKRILELQEYTRTDESGFFQAEITGYERPVVELDGSRCRFDFEKLPREESFHDFGEIVCQIE